MLVLGCVLWGDFLLRMPRGMREFVHIFKEAMGERKVSEKWQQYNSWFCKEQWKHREGELAVREDL